MKAFSKSIFIYKAWHFCIKKSISLMVFQNGNKASYTLWKLDCPIYFIRPEIKPLWGLWYLVSSTEKKKKIITTDKYQINQFLCWCSYCKGQLNVSFVWLNPETCSGHKKAPGCHLPQLQTRCRSSTGRPSSLAAD